MTAYTWSPSWQTCGSIKFPSKVFWRGSFWSALELQRDTSSYNNNNYHCHSMQTFFFFIGQKPTTWPANNCLQIMGCSCTMLSNCVWLQIVFCSCVNETTRDHSRVKKGRSLCFPKIFIKKQTWWSNDKTIIELGYRKISWFANVSHIKYLPQPSASANNWSSRHWEITIFFSTSIIIIIIHCSHHLSSHWLKA